MPTPEDQKEAQASPTGSTPTEHSGQPEAPESAGASSASSGEAETPPAVETAADSGTSNPYYDGSYDDGYHYDYGDGETTQTVEPQPEEPKTEEPKTEEKVAEKPSTAVVAAGGAGTPAKPPEPPKADEDDEEEGMLRMSFLEHLEELRSRILRALGGLGVAFVLCLIFANELWVFVSKPAIDALKKIGADPNLAQITPMDAFTTIWVKVPMLAAVFLASPWILYQVWAFIAPGLYRKERRWATPFVLSSAGLFITGGLFAYFVAFRFGLEFLLGIGRDINVKPVVSIVEYFDLFVNVMLGIGLVFELPILVFFLTLLRITTPGFLMRNSRYAILIIVIIAAVVTPTPDVFNLMLFAVPMCVLYFMGVFASYLLVLHREDQPFPWRAFLITIGVILLILAGVLYIAVTRYNYRFVHSWPFLTR